MSDEVEYEALSPNAGLGVRRSSILTAQFFLV